MKLLHKTMNDFHSFWDRLRHRLETTSRLLGEHEKLVSEFPGETVNKEDKEQFAQKIRDFCTRVADAGVDIGDGSSREQLRALLHEWSGRIYDLSGDYPKFMLATYNPSFANEIRRHIAAYWYFIVVIVAAILMSLLLVFGPAVYRDFTRPTIEIDMPQRSFACTPGQVGCLFTTQIRAQRISASMRLYLLGKPTNSATGGWIKLGRGATVATNGTWEVDGQIGEYFSSVQTNLTYEVIAVLFEESANPLATYPSGFIFDDYKSLPGLIASSNSARYSFTTPTLADFVLDSSQRLSAGQLYGYRMGGDIFRVGYTSSSDLGPKTLSEKSVRIQYDSSPNSYGIWGISGLQDLDLSKYNALVFNARGSPKDCDFVIKLKDSPLSTNSCCEAEVKFSQHMPVPSAWTTVTIPLVDFRLNKPSFNFGSLNVLTLGFNEQLGSCDVEIKAIGFRQYPELSSLPPSPVVNVSAVSQTLFCVPSYSAVPRCSINLAGTITDLANPADYRVHLFGRTVGERGWIVSWGSVDDKGLWKAEFVFPSLEVLPGVRGEIYAGLLGTSSEQSQKLLNYSWINEEYRNGLELLGYSGPITLTFGDFLPFVSEQLAGISSAQIYAYSTVPSWADFKIEPYPREGYLEKTDQALHTIYMGRTGSVFGVWGIQRLNGFNASAYRSLKFDAKGGGGAFVVKLKDKNDCESLGYSSSLPTIDWQTISIPVAGFIGNQCKLSTAAIDVVTFGFVGESTIDVVLDDIRFAE